MSPQIVADHWILAQLHVGAAHYILLDGDRIGSQMEDLLFRNALPRLYFLVQDLHEALLLLSGQIRKAGGLVYICGGDTVLGSVENLRSFLARLDSVRPALPCTFSAGIGRTVGEALIALKLAKARGPGQVVRLRRTLGQVRSAHWEPTGWKEEHPRTRGAAIRGRRPSAGPRRRSVTRGAAASSRRRGWA
jgi:hypothetical protein